MIARDPSAAASKSYDLVVVGGGIYGAAMVLEAARRGMKPLLLEGADFGQYTSWNSLRIVHGGLRYLQRLDLRRFFESVAERKWLLQHFPELVKPLPCLMPLYEKGLRRASVLRVALRINDILSRNRNEATRPDRALPDGRLLSASEAASLFPPLDRRGLKGAALWYDAVMPDSQRLLIEMLRWASNCGAVVLNYVRAEDAVTRSGTVEGVVARDTQSQAMFEYAARIVVNCAGPWSRRVAKKFDRDVPRLFHPSLAFNVSLDREPFSEVAVAVTPDRHGARTYFLHPWKGRILAGTYHAAWEAEPEDPPTEALVERFLSHLRAAIPGFDVGLRDVLRVHWGLLPASRPRTEDLAVREVIHDHGANGGLRGLYSVSGVKFTTARLVAERTLRFIQRSRGDRLSEPLCDTAPVPAIPPSLEELGCLHAKRPDQARALVRTLILDEAVLHPEDLLLRRTDWGIHPEQGKTTAGWLAELVGGGLASSVRGSAELQLRDETEIDTAPADENSLL